MISILYFRNAKNIISHILIYSKHLKNNDFDATDSVFAVN